MDRVAALGEEDKMVVQIMRANANPRSEDEARALVRHVESLFMPWNIDALVAGFTEDCVVRFGTVAEFRGREALREFFMARSAKQTGLSLDQAVSQPVGRHHRQCLARRMEGCRERRSHARLRRGNLADA